MFLSIHEKLLIACGRRAFLVSVFFAMASNGVDAIGFPCGALNVRVMRLHTNVDAVRDSRMMSPRLL